MEGLTKIEIAKMYREFKEQDKNSKQEDEICRSSFRSDDEDSKFGEGEDSKEYLEKMYKLFKQNAKPALPKEEEEFSNVFYIEEDDEAKSDPGCCKRAFNKLKYPLSLIFAVIVILFQRYILSKGLFLKTIEFESVKSTEAGLQPGCSANSFMINDGVCDEVTNMERCLFDGGDCCQPDKNSNLCNICKCIIDFDVESLNQSYSEFQVEVFEIFAEYSDRVTFIAKSVTNVETLDTCSWICMDSSEDNVNSWRFVPDNGYCECTWADIDAALCIKNVSTLSIFDYKQDMWYNQEVAMVQLWRRISCDCMTHFVRVRHASASHILYGESSSDPVSAWHCQQVCQQSYNCTHFSWKHLLGSERISKGTCSLFQTEYETLDLAATNNWWITAPLVCSNSTSPQFLDYSYANQTSTTARSLTTTMFSQQPQITNSPTFFMVAEGTNFEKLDIEPVIFVVGDGKVTRTNCSLPRQSEKIRMATGNMLKDANGKDGSIVCGGFFEDDSGISDRCYLLGRPTEDEPFATMTIPRGGAFSIPVFNGTALWITGGAVKIHSYSGFRVTSTTEYVFNNGSVVPGPNINGHFAFHCMVRLDNDNILLTGVGLHPEFGVEQLHDTQPIIFGKDLSVINDKVSEKSFKRMQHSCSLVKDATMKASALVLVGGISGNYAFGDLSTSVTVCKTHLLEETGLGVCEEQAQLPVPTLLSASILINDGYTLLIMSGKDKAFSNHNTTYKIECQLLKCELTELEHLELDPGRSGSVALPISQEFVQDCPL